MVNKFDGASWIKGAGSLNGLREQWEADTFETHQALPVVALSFNPIDLAVIKHTNELRYPWYDAIGNMGVKLGSDASKMRATGENYSLTEDAAEVANKRFWEI